MNHVLNGTNPKADNRLLADIANAPDVHGVGFGVNIPLPTTLGPCPAANAHVQPAFASILNGHYKAATATTDPAPVTDYNRGRMLRVSGTGETATSVAIREGRNIDDVIRGWEHADRDCSDAETRPDAFDGGCAADCAPLTKRPVGPVAPQPNPYKVLEDACVLRGLYMAVNALREVGFAGSADLVRDKAQAFAAENGVTL